jgi:hypothetical protein
LFRHVKCSWAHHCGDRDAYRIAGERAFRRPHEPRAPAPNLKPAPSARQQPQRWNIGAAPATSMLHRCRQPRGQQDRGRERLLYRPWPRYRLPEQEITRGGPHVRTRSSICSWPQTVRRRRIVQLKKTRRWNQPSGSSAATGSAPKRNCAGRSRCADSNPSRRAPTAARSWPAAPLSVSRR